MSADRVLVIEDDEVLAPMLTSILGETGCRVSLEPDANALAPEWVGAHVDLLVLDLTLPGKDGLTFCRELRAQAEGSRVKVLMLTARADREDQLAALASGADDYLAKPFDIEVLLARSERLLQARAVERTERRRARLAEALLQLTTRGEAGEPSRATLGQICREARLLFEADACIMRLADDGLGRTLELGDPEPAEAVLPAEGIDELVVRGRSERAAFLTEARGVADRTCTVLVAPLVQYGEAAGILLLVDASGQQQLGHDDLAALEQFAHHAAAVVASVRLSDARRAQRRAERAQAAVSAVALALAGQTDRQEALDLLAREALELVGGAVASVVLIDPRTGSVRLGAQVGGRLPTGPLALRLHEGFLGHVLADGQPRTTEAYSALPGTSERIRQSGLLGAVAVAVTLEGRMLGALLVADVSPTRRYTEDDIQTLQLLTSHGALAIERANRLDAQAQRAEQADVVRVRMEALAALAEARAGQLEAVLEQMADAVVVVDRAGCVTRVNRAAEQLLGAERGRLVEQPCLLDDALLDGQTRSRSDDRVIAQALAAGRTTVEREYLFQCAGREHLLSVSVAPVAQAGTIAGAVAVIRDVTERRRLEEQLRQADKLRALGELAMGVAHNFNNTLAAIMSRSELLAGEVRHPLVADAVDYVLRAAEDGAAMIRRIQAFARRTSTGVRVAIDIEDLLRDAVAVSQPRWRDAAQRRGASVAVQLDLVATPPILGDPGELREVLVNLINNAADALPQGGLITVGSRPHGRLVELFVSDNGVGMPPEIQRHIFEPFYTTKGTDGTGLGLAVSYGIVANHGGTLQVESEPNRGTTLRIWVPAAGGAAGPPGLAVTARHEEATMASGGATGESTRVLVVDDDLKLAGMLQQILHLDGHAVDICASGAEALEAAAQQTYSLVLTDVGMPGMSGLELARALTEAYPGLPVALITGWGNAIDPAEREASGARYMLSKPYRIEQVRQMVNSALGEARG